MNQPVCTKPRRFPRALWILLGITASSLVLYLAFVCSAPFSDWFNQTVSPFVRALLAGLTNWIPFSVAELLLLLLPVVLFLLIRLGIRKYCDTWRDVLVFCLAILLSAAMIFCAFVWGFAPSYRGTTLDQKLGLSRRAVSADDLYQTALMLAEQVGRESTELGYSDATEFSVMPHDFGQMNDLLLEAYDSVHEEYSFVQKLDSRLKPVMLSQPMSYTHITGVYTFFTGEANINVYFPDYTLPFTAAHELAHQRGIAREDEANFMAFLACTRAKSAYIRYSGYLNLYEYVASALYSASPELYWKAMERLPETVKGEMRAYSDFFDQFRDSVAGEISETVNNTVLEMHGTQGVKSYGMVVDLAVAYYLP